MMHQRIASATTLLMRALTRSAAAAGIGMTIVDAGERPWASVTFTGARHRLVVEAIAGEAFDTWLTGLEEADLALEGHIAMEFAVVEMTATAERIRATLEVLTLVDG